MDGNSYQWGNTFLRWSYGGSGIGGDYWLNIVQLVFCLCLLYLGWRGARPPFIWMLLLWNLAQAANAFYNALVFPDSYRFQGDTLGIDLSLAWVGPTYFAVIVVLSLIWAIRNRNSRESQPYWSRTNTVLLAIFLGIIPVQFVLLRFGIPHGTSDQIGVLLTIVQWAILNWALAARGKSTATRPLTN